MEDSIKMSTIKCIARRMAGGSKHEHISDLQWQRVEGGSVLESGQCTRQQMVEFIEKNGNESVWCPDSNPKLQGAWVHVHRNGTTKYVQTVADGRTTDNLLHLPTF